jgi:hypothetical protein
MNRTLSIAIVQLDTMRSGAAEHRCIQQIGPPSSSRYRNGSYRADRRQDGFSLARDVTGTASDHHSDGIKEMPRRSVPDVLV